MDNNQDYEEETYYSNDQQQPQDDFDNQQQQQQHQQQQQYNDQDGMNQDDDYQPQGPSAQDTFYFRYYVGHKSSQTGHEFLEFQLRDDGLLRYANDSRYKRDLCIRKEVKLNTGLFEVIKNKILESQLVEADDATWPLCNDIGEQQIEIKAGNQHVFFSTCKIGSKSELLSYKADQSLEVFYNLSHDLKQIFFDIIGLHFRLQEI